MPQNTQWTDADVSRATPEEVHIALHAGLLHDLRCGTPDKPVPGFGKSY
jgi:hypothetical protein